MPNSQLRKLAWKLQSTAALYARNRRHLNLDVMTQEERQLMEALDQAFRRVNVPVCAPLVAARGLPCAMENFVNPSISAFWCRIGRATGIRARVMVEDVVIKFEIVLEARVALQPPGPEDLVCSIACLSLGDMACSKLLANSDSWNDDSVFNRMRACGSVRLLKRERGQLKEHR